MLRLTFLGHQGWWVSGPDRNLLIDPLLTDAFGHGGLVGRVWPPRVVDFEAMPPVDGVLLTHEHDDHFDIPSLHCLDRRIPVWLSARASAAAADALQQMGFATVHRIDGGEAFELGALRVETFCPDPQPECSDEWDVLAFVVSAAGHGAIASSVDVPPPDAMLRALAGRPPSVWCIANNTSSAAWADALGTTANAAGDAAHIAAAMVKRHTRLRDAVGGSPVTWICGSGWSYDGARRWMNNNAFPTTCAALANAMRKALPGEAIDAPIPGATVHLREGGVHATTRDTPWLACAPRSAWPDRSFHGDVATMPDYAPACGRRSLRLDDDAVIDDGLHDLARALYGGPLFRQLHAVADAAVGIVLRRGEQGAPPTVHRYVPQACRFAREPASVDPRTGLIAGLECWATDFAAVVRGEIGPSAVCYAGRMRYWSRAPARVRMGPDLVLRWAHPLRRPAAARRLYRAQIAALPATPPPIAPRR